MINVVSISAIRAAKSLSVKSKTSSSLANAHPTMAKKNTTTLVFILLIHTLFKRLPNNYELIAIKINGQKTRLCLKDVAKNRLSAILLWLVAIGLKCATILISENMIS